MNASGSGLRFSALARGLGNELSAAVQCTGVHYIHFEVGYTFTNRTLRPEYA